MAIFLQYYLSKDNFLYFAIDIAINLLLLNFFPCFIKIFSFRFHYLQYHHHQSHSTIVILCFKYSLVYFSLRFLRLIHFHLKSCHLMTFISFGEKNWEIIFILHYLRIKFNIAINPQFFTLM